MLPHKCLHAKTAESPQSKDVYKKDSEHVTGDNIYILFIYIYVRVYLAPWEN